MRAHAWGWLAGFVAFLAAPLPAIERDIKLTFAVQPGCTVKIDTYRGSIVVTESDEPEVQITALMEIGVETEAEADRVRARLQLDVAEADNTITVRARNPSETRARFVWDDKYQIDLAWRIRVPRQCNVELRTVSGGITVGSLTGRVVAQSETGPISVKRIDGSVDAQTELGDVIISRCSGPVKARVMRGTIRVGTMGGATVLKNTSGDIEVLAAKTDLVAEAEAGDVIVGFPRDFVGAAKLTTSGGSIHAKIDPAASCMVDASAVWGRIDSLLPMAVESGANGKRKLAGRIGAGASPITLRANGGHVKLTQGETYFEEGGEPWLKETAGESLFRRSQK